MSLHPVRAADDQHRRVQHLQCALRLCGKIYVARGVEKRDAGVSAGETRLLGEDCDPAVALDGVRVQEAVSVIHAARFAERSAHIEQSLGQCCLTGIDMG